MGRQQLAKQIFGVPSLEITGRIADSDAVAQAEAAHYQFSAKMRGLELQYEVEASKLRADFLAELAELQTADAE